MEKRLNIRISSDDYAQLQEVKRARGQLSDSNAIRAMISEQHDALRKAGAFRTMQRLEQQTQGGKPNGQRKKPRRRA